MLKIFTITNLRYGVIGSLIASVIVLISKEVTFLPEIVIAGFLTGFFVREIETSLSKTKLRKLSFKSQILLRPVIYIGVTFLIIVMIILLKILFNNECDILTALSENGFWNYLFNTNFYLLFILLVTIGLLVSFIWQVNLLLGPGVLMRFVAGKYKSPKTEQKIFMFMDLNSSVRMAEKLGTEKYSELLKDFFLELTEPVLKFKGEVYQYVGDEVVVVWDKENGIKNDNAIKLVFEVIDKIEKRKKYYLGKYGLLPVFKVGIHYGETIVREVGEIKKEIVYHGDVLNTTSRIRSVCNELDKKILISKDLYEILEEKLYSVFEPVGEIDLKGKKEKVFLYSVTKK